LVNKLAKKYATDFKIVVVVVKTGEETGESCCCYLCCCYCNGSLTKKYHKSMKFVVKLLLICDGKHLTLFEVDEELEGSLYW